MKTIRNMITAATLITGLSLGTVAMVAMVAPSGAGAALAPQTAQTAQTAQVHAFWQYLYALEHAPNTCGVVYEGDDPTADHVIYAGGCLQSFWLTMTNYAHDPDVTFVWDILGN